MLQNRAQISDANCCRLKLKLARSCGFFKYQLITAIMISTSVCLILFPERAADSKKCLRDMKILNIVSKSLTSPPIILKIFQPEISVVVEISTDFDLLTIVEFQIYSFILPILQANLGKILAKIFSDCVISRKYVL